MNIGHLFLSFTGRIGRLQLWIGMVAIGLAGVAIEWVFGVPLTGDTVELRPRIISFVVGIVSLYPMAALAVKRLHDRNQPGLYASLLVAASGLAALADLLGYGDPTRLGVAAWIATFVLAVIALAFLIELGFRRGTPGPNRFGPEPSTRARDLTP